MIPFDEAFARIMEEVGPPQTESASISDSVGRVLAENIFATIQMPVHTMSSVDGFAVCAPCGSSLNLVGEMAAGQPELLPLGNSANSVRVFTGSRLPPDCNSVVMQEDVDLDQATLTLRTVPTPGMNLRHAGEEFSSGQQVLTRGIRLNPPALALAAAAGHARLPVARRPTVAVVETGNELRTPGETLRDGEIFAANGIGLEAAITRMGCLCKTFRARDDEAALRQTLREAASIADVVITSGGVSVGRLDLVRRVLADLGGEERFWRVAIRPGKPFCYARLPNGVRFFGLPGNPVSTLVTFYLLVRPTLRTMLGAEPDPWQEGICTTEHQTDESVEIFERVITTHGTIQPLRNQGSHMLSGLAAANALARIPRGHQPLPAGFKIRFLPLDW